MKLSIVWKVLFENLFSCKNKSEQEKKAKTYVHTLKTIMPRRHGYMIFEHNHWFYVKL